MKCPNCGAQSEGAFCSDCGAPLKGAKCLGCNAPLSAGARFCNNCGAATGSTRRGAAGSSKLPWLVAATSVVILVGIVAWPAVRRDDAQTSDGRVPLDQIDGVGNPTGATGPGPLTGTPREQADRLFNRVMTERESGDTAQARFFVPMAVQAYERAGELDPDGYYHLSLLHYAAGDFQAALASARRILATSPNHLLGLSAAASVARAAGDDATAHKYYQQFLSAYDVESKQTRPEYQDHGKMLPELKTEAEMFVKGRSAGR